jgi:hypothetical protein
MAADSSQEKSGYRKDACIRTSEANRVDAGQVVLDTFTRLALIENTADIGEANKRYEHIAPITTHDNRGLLLNWHERKAGGTIVEAASGTAAYGGQVDMLIRLQRVAGQPHHSHMRQIETLGRIYSAFEEPQAIELNKQKTKYMLAGSVGKAKQQSIENQILLVLPEDSTGLTVPEIVDAVKGVYDKDVSRTTVEHALDRLLKQAGSLVRQAGQGYKKNHDDPFRYSRVKPF